MVEMLSLRITSLQFFVICYIGRQKAAANVQDEELTITKFFINSKIDQLTD